MKIHRHVSPTGAVLWLLSLSALAAAQDTVKMDAPASAEAGSKLRVTWSGSADRSDVIAVVQPGAPDSKLPIGFRANAGSGGEVVLVPAPDVAGKYELRFYSRSKRATLARSALTLVPAKASVSAPATAVAGATIPVEWTGPSGQSDVIGVVAAGAPEGQRPLKKSYVHEKSPLDLRLPEKAGSYEIRYITGKSRLTLAKTQLTIGGASAKVEGPKSAVAGTTIAVKWSGPNNRSDTINIVRAGAPEGDRTLWRAYVHGKSPVELRVPEQAGEYEIRYITAETKATLATAKLTVTGASATVDAPASAVAGSTVQVRWTGPKGDHDVIGVVAAGAPDNHSPERREHLRKSPLAIRLPDAPGEYEVRYITGQTEATLASAKITATAESASIDGPVTAEAGNRFKVKWNGPANQFDHIVIAAKDAPATRWVSHGYVRKGKPLSLRAPLITGSYELRYLTGLSHTILARAEVNVVPAKQEPGTVRVSLRDRAAATGAGGGAVEIILDASGSMLQRIGKQRRIDIALQTLKTLSSSTIPAGTPFALRVFGGDAAGCQTDLELPLGPLDAAGVAGKIAGVEAKRNARTPIAASLEAVAADLKSAKGDRLVILVTDGEETCGGDPAAAIEKLQKRGVQVRVNIVGFAIDDPKLEATFQLWSEAGRGTYFDARDASGLHKALSMALEPAFDVLDSKKNVVASGFVGGAPVQVMPGRYSVVLKGGKGGKRSITVRANEENAVQF